MKNREIRDYMKSFCEGLNRTNRRRTFKFEEDESVMRIVKYTGMFRGEVCSVSKDAQESYFVKVDSDIKCPYDELFDFIGGVRKYGETPLNERREKRWRIRLGNYGVVYNYLNYYPCSGKHERVDEVEAKGYQTKFTWQEIAKYLKTDDEKIIDWFIERFGEEVE